MVFIVEDIHQEPGTTYVIALKLGQVSCYAVFTITIDLHLDQM